MEWIDNYEGKVILGNSIEAMHDIPDDAFDITITDPPYSAKTHDGAMTAPDKKLITTFGCISGELFLATCAELVRVTRRWVVMTCDWRYIADLEKAGLPLVRFGIWVKPNGVPQFTGDRPSTGWEAVAILHRPGVKKWKGGGKPAVWTYNKINGEHPTQKPLALLKDWMRLFSEEGEIVFDPFCGSGSTLVAAKTMGRRFVGIEIDPKYHAIAERRISSAGEQKELWPEE